MIPIFSRGEKNNIDYKKFLIYTTRMKTVGGKFNILHTTNDNA